MIDIFYFSHSGNTKKFVNKLNHISYDILHFLKPVNKEYLLFTPTYSGRGESFIPHPVREFLKIGKNALLLRGIVGSGDSSFIHTFCQGSKALAHRYGVPLLYTYELCGTDKDVGNVKGLLKQWKK